MNTPIKALSALLSTVFLWALMAVIARIAVSQASSVTMLFFRLLIGFICFLPIFITLRVWKKHNFKKLLLVSLGSSVNLTFFMLGIAHTSASVSQIIYAAIPIIILVFGMVVQKRKFSTKRILGVVLGFTGLALIVYLSAMEKGETITGSLQGNLLILIAMSGWTFYLLSSKHLTRYFQPLEIGSTSIIVSFTISLLLFCIEIITTNTIPSLSTTTVMSALYMGFFGTFLTYILYQYAVKHLSTLTVSLSSYVQPIITTILAIILIEEKMTIAFLFGSLLVLFGVFLVTPIPSRRKR